MQLFEKHRPKSLAEVIGQDRAIAKVRRFIDRGEVGGQAFWLSGMSGTGKTTIARILAREVADDLFIREYDSADQLTTEELGELERTLCLTAWGKGGRAVIVNEAHGLRAAAQRRLDGLLERIPSRVVWLFTTTWDGQESLMDGIDAGPLLSRCVEVRLTNQGLAESFAEHVRTIAQAEGLDGRPIAEYVRLARDCRNNCRAMLQAVQSGRMAEGGGK